MDISKRLTGIVLVYFMIFMGISSAYGLRAIDIKGIVKDKDSGEVIINCNVLLQGTEIATQTNELGEFTIKSEGNLPVVLIFSHKNYEKQFEEVIGSRDTIFIMTPIKGEVSTALMQYDISGDPFIQSISKEIDQYNSNNLIEKVYIDTDKDVFISGENVWYSGYTVLGSDHKYSMESKILYIDLIDMHKQVIQRESKEIRLGKSEGVIKLPEGLLAGDYELRAYTDWMRNYDELYFFKKKIQVLKEGIEEVAKEDELYEEVLEYKDIDLQFFPEGGDAVLGIEGVIAFKAIGSDGLGRSINGKVLNSKEEIIAVIGSIDRGSGFFNLKPESGEQYKAVIDNGQVYNLPEAKAVGYVLTVLSSTEDNLRIKVDASDVLKDRPFYIIGQIRQQKYFQGKFEFKYNSPLIFDIPKEILSSGVMTLTLFDNEGKARNERVVFINKGEDLKITTRLNRKTFGKRDKIVLDIDVKDKEGVPVSTELSVSIVDDIRAGVAIDESSILTHLLLESEIKGYIENPGVYFKENKRSTRARSRIDLLMLTNGWRRIKWTSINSKKVKKGYEFSKGISISGIAKQSRKRVLANTSLTVLSSGRGGEGIYFTETDSEGRFKIEGINQSDSIDLEFVASDEEGDPIDVRVLLDEDEEDLPILNSRKLVSGSNVQLFSTIDKVSYVEASKQKREVDSLYGYDEAVLLDEVYLEAKRKRDEVDTSFLSSRPSEFGVKPDDVAYLDADRPNFYLSDVLQHLAGVRSFTSVDKVTLTPTIKVFYRGGSPLIVLDGIPIDAQTLDQLGLAGPAVSVNIERVELLSENKGLVYGRRGAGGVILLYSRRGGRVIKANTAATSKHTIAGYSVTKEFYSPKYNVRLPKHNKPDYRTTLYWNPRVKTDNKGKATVTFYNSDITEQIQVNIQGLTDKGTPGRYIESFGESRKNH